ncbi:MAG: rhodanese-like domain-containing protein [Acidiferrobacter sp.]
MMALKHVEAPELQQWLATGAEIVVVDVRTPAEVARGGIPGARAIPLHLLPLAGPLDKERPLVFYCQSGGRSQQACAFLHQQGYEKIYNLRGGIMAWQRSGLPVAPITSAMAAGTAAGT